MRAIAREVSNLLNNFDVLGTFRSRPSQHLPDGPHDFATLTFNLGAYGACHAHGDLDLRAFDLETDALYCTLPRPAYGFVTYLIEAEHSKERALLTRPFDNVFLICNP